MRDPCLAEANRLIDEAATMAPSEAPRFLFDCYRTALPESRDALLLALIGAVVVGQQRVRFTRRAAS